MGVLLTVEGLEIVEACCGRHTVCDYSSCGLVVVDVACGYVQWSAALFGRRRHDAEGGVGNAASAMAGGRRAS